MLSLLKHFFSVFMATAFSAFVILLVVSIYIQPQKVAREPVQAQHIPQLPSPAKTHVTTISIADKGLVFAQIVQPIQAIEPSEAPSPILSVTPTTIPSPSPTTEATPTPTSSPIPVLSTPTPTEISPTMTPTPTNVPVTASDIDAFFSKYSGYYSVDQDKLKRIARCESGMNPNASNLQYAGMYQFGPGTWQSVRSKMNADPNTDLRYNAEEAIKTAAFYLSINGERAWPNCQ